MRLPRIACSAAVLVLLAACQGASTPSAPPTSPPSAPPPDAGAQVDAPVGPCRPDDAAALVGRDRISDDEAKRLTGATLVRQVAPGDAVTSDFRVERVTIETDPATGKIVSASCV